MNIANIIAKANEVKLFTKVGRSFKLKTPLEIGKYTVYTMGRDTNGNKIMRFNNGDKTVTRQISSKFSISIDTLAQPTEMDMDNIENILDDMNK